MGESFVIFEQLDEEWARLVASREATAALSRWSTDPALAGAASLDAVLARRLNPDPVAADRVLAALARRARGDRVAARTLLQAMIPALHRLARTLGGGRADPAADLCAIAWELIVTFPIERRPERIAANLWWDIRKAYRRHHGATACRSLTAEGGRGELERFQVLDATDHERFTTGELDDVGERVAAHDQLMRLLHRAALPAENVEILWRRVCGDDEDDVCAKFGMTRTQVWGRRKRALAHLRRLARAS